MQFSLEKEDGLKRHLRIVFPADEINKLITVELTNIAKKARIDGFRAGKVPIKVVRRHYGEEVINDIIQKKINSFMNEYCRDNKENIVNYISLKEVKNRENGDFSCLVVYDVFPEVELIDLSEYKIQIPELLIEEHELIGFIDTLQSDLAVDGVLMESMESQKGDKAIIDYQCIDNLDENKISKKNMITKEVKIGSGKLGDEFEAGLEGMKQGETKVLILNVPQTDKQPATITKFSVTVKKLTRLWNMPIKYNHFIVKILGIKDEDLSIDFSQPEKHRVAIRPYIIDFFKNKASWLIFNELNLKIKDIFYTAYKDLELPESMVMQEFKNILMNKCGDNKDELMKLMSLGDECKKYEQQAKKNVLFDLVIDKIIANYQLKPNMKHIADFMMPFFCNHLDLEANVEVKDIKDEKIKVRVLNCMYMSTKNQAFEKILEQMQVTTEKIKKS